MLGKEMVIKELTWIDIDVRSYEELFEKMAVKFWDLGYVTEGYLSFLKEREKTYPTALPVVPYAIAIPHTGSKGIIKPFIAPVRLKNSVSWREMSDVEKNLDVRMTFFLGFTEPEEFVELLQVLMYNFERQDWVEKLFVAKTAEDLYEIAGDMEWKPNFY